MFSSKELFDLEYEKVKPLYDSFRENDLYSLVLRIFPTKDNFKGIYIHKSISDFVHIIWFIGFHLEGGLNYMSEEFQTLLVEISYMWAAGRESELLLITRYIIEKAKSVGYTSPERWHEEFAFVLYASSLYPEYVKEHSVHLYGDAREFSAFNEDFKATYNSMRGW